MLDQVRYAEFDPPAPLAGRVRFWRLQGEAAEGDPEPVLPDGCLEVIVHLGDPFRIATDRGTEMQPRLLLAGPGTRPVRLASTGRIDVIGARFEPGVASALAPLEDLVDTVPALDSVRGDLASGLAEELAEPRRGECWTDVLARRVTPWLRGGDALVSRAVAHLRASKGRTTVDALAGRFGLSTRQLERRFRAHTGLGPKLFARLVRFQEAWRLAEHAPSLAAVAAQAGYFDQAHLVRDFRRFAGAPPGRFLRGEHELARLFSGR